MCTENGRRRRRRRGTAVDPMPMIFIVDDDPSVRTSLTRLMRSAGHEARAFADAEAYLEAFGAAETAVYCVILDLHMPGMSGLDLQEAIDRKSVGEGNNGT